MDGLGYDCEIVGTLKNNTSRSYSYVSIEYSIYDEEGNIIDTAMDNINNLGAGETWKFTASTFGWTDVKPVTAKLKDITYW